MTIYVTTSAGKYLITGKNKIPVPSSPDNKITFINCRSKSKAIFNTLYKT